MFFLAFFLSLCILIRAKAMFVYRLFFFNFSEFFRLIQMFFPKFFAIDTAQKFTHKLKIDCPMVISETF